MTFKNSTSRFGLILLGLLISLLFLEVVVRLANSITPFINTKFWVSHPLYGIKYIPNKSGYYARPEYKTHFTINSTGWRDSEHSMIKKADTIRILVLGDSFVESFQVPLQNTWFKILEQELNEQNPKQKFEVIAMGIGGSSPTQQYFALINEGLSYQPDIVVQALYTQNDIVGNSRKLDFSPHRPYFELADGQLKFIPTIITKEDFDRQHKPLFVFARQKSLLWNFISDRLNLAREKRLKESFAKSNLGYPPDYQIYKVDYSDDWQRAWELTESIILQTKNAVEATGGQYHLVSLANIEQVEPDYWPEIQRTYPKIAKESLDLEKPEKLLKEFAHSSDINYFNLLTTFKQFRTAHPNQPLYFWSDAHWNSTGYRLAGETIASYLNDYLMSN